MNELSKEKCFQSFSDTLNVLKSTTQHQKVLHLIVDRISRIYRCQSCAVVIIDPNTEYLHIENNYGLSLTFCKSFRTRLATGAIGKLLWTGIPILISDSALDPALSEEVTLEHPFGSAVCVQIAIDHRTLGYLHANSIEKGAFSEEDVRLLQCFADLAGLALIKTQLYEENLRLDIIDHETGLEKYVAFFEKLNASMERAKDFNEQFALVLLDIDNFKDVVHTHGYDVSKQLLKEMGTLVRSKVRTVDACGRYGFDEFIILLANSRLDDAVAYAKDFATTVASTPFTARKISSAVSIGISAYPLNGTTVQELLLTMKEALFEAQRGGRNTVYYYPTMKHIHGELVA